MVYTLVASVNVCVQMDSKKWCTSSSTLCSQTPTCMDVRLDQGQSGLNGQCSAAYLG